MSDSGNAPNRDAARRARLAYLAVTALSKLDPPILVVPDTETGEVGLGADFHPADLVLQHLDLRLRLILLLDCPDAEALSAASGLRSAALILKHWPETAAVGLIANDSELSCLVLEPFDVEPSIATPSGDRLPPTPRREPAPLGEAVKAYLDVVVPSWERVPLPDLLPVVEYDQVRRQIAYQARSDIVGRRANIDEKRAALDSIVEADARWAADLASRGSSKGLTAEDLALEVERRAGKRS